MEQILAQLQAGYEWKLSLITAVAIVAITKLLRIVGVMLVPAFRESARINKETFLEKMKRASYAENQAWNRKWGLFFWVVIFAGIVPFTLTSEPHSILRIVRDCVVILLVYDFFYYLVHRFLFHDSGYFKGPLIWVHAVHHRQHNPCRADSSFIHPLEVAGGLGLYVGTIFGLSFLLGDFSIPTVVITWIAFSEINQHNHDLWKADKFPFKYLNTMSVMHHNHHAHFTGGNFATISLLYDWMFGTLDYGKGYGKVVHGQRKQATPAE
ncbi:sterol desaturase family protein [Novosphingobium sp. TH158]|uniref:sterol desaturase family protein n=1 Tax=Novosphingobium sp. TH158 TaxID=2067455 RepID=UPI000C7A87D9|nr:sterol desaturase family protein [Novosphingobium sp. TH158]PLK26000.1 sterol desaturase [Novosphingobium sp. TH158]